MQRIEDRLQETKERAKLDGRVKVAGYADGTVDGEFTVTVPRGVSTEDTLRKLYAAFGQTPGSLTLGYWLSVGERYVIKADDEIYKRHRGMNEISTYYTRMRTATITPTFGAARTKLTRGAEKKFRRKADTVFVRIHWNPSNSKPKR